MKVAIHFRRYDAHYWNAEVFTAKEEYPGDDSYSPTPIATAYGCLTKWGARRQALRKARNYLQYKKVFVEYAEIEECR